VALIGRTVSSFANEVLISSKFLILAHIKLLDFEALVTFSNLDTASGMQSKEFRKVTL
jgi:hypothetical protein